MKATHVSIRPTEAAEEAGRPALTPELLAASGARYSRNNEGLAAILEKIDPCNLDRSVDSIFRMIDYGHMSIQDMAPVSLFVDEASMYLVYLLWTLCPVAGGQESSTRFIRISAASIPAAEEFGIKPLHEAEWQEHHLNLFAAYEQSLSFWEEIAATSPTVVRIPGQMLADTSEKAQKAVARMRRNYAFDRARYFLPLAARTNVMLTMSARGWVQLVQHLLSHPLLEARNLGSLINQELMLVVPRLVRHATRKPSIEKGLFNEFAMVSTRSLSERAPYLDPAAPGTDHPAGAFLDVMEPPAGWLSGYAVDLAFHDSRYAYIGQKLRRVAVRFGWQAVAIGEVRDLNRHRTGNKFCPLLPVGFYCAQDQLPAELTGSSREAAASMLLGIARKGQAATLSARALLSKGDPTYAYRMPLGAQTQFEHLTTADKFIYEAELRTGTGAHFRYAQHLRDCLALWYQRFPDTKGLILEGSAEPE